MKIVDRQDFLSLPSGTVFQFYAEEACLDDSLCLKLETLEKDHLPDDFVYLPLTGGFLSDAYNSTEEYDMYLRMQDDGEDFDIDFDKSIRDGLFDADQLFAVWSEVDVRGLINSLLSGLVSGWRVNQLDTEEEEMSWDDSR